MYFRFTIFSKWKSIGVEYKTDNTQHIYMKMHLVLYILTIMYRFCLVDQFRNWEKSFKRIEKKKRE